MKILVKEVRRKRKLSLIQVEIITGVKKSSLHDIETGRTIPRLDTLEDLAKGLKVHISDLYDSEWK